MILCDFYWSRPKDPRIPLGHASLLASLSAAEVDVRPMAFAVNELQGDASAVVRHLLDLCDGVPLGQVDIALGAYVWGEELLQAVLEGLRLAGFDGRIILGGPQISYSPAGIDRLYPHADAFVRGYGEHALVDLARQAGRPSIAGVHWSGELDLCEQAQVDLALLPSPWLAGVIPLQGQRFVRWETQRGCPFKCAFCQHREAGARLPRTTLDRGRIFQEIELFCAAGVDDIAVLDPIFNANPAAVAILEHFAALGFRGRISLQCRAELTTPEFLQAAARVGAQLEFGLQTIHPAEGRAIRRNNSIAKANSVLARVRLLGLHHEVSVIYGLPEQTLESFEQTVAWCLKRCIPAIKAFPLLLLRGTELERDRAAWGLEDDGSAMAAVVASKTFSHDDWLQMDRIARALAATEGHHPASLQELLELVPAAPHNAPTWRPLAA
jgi:hypothetical protein